MHAVNTASKTKRGPFADLLPWQWIVVFALCGVFALEYPAAGITAATLLQGCMLLFRRLPLSFFWVPTAFGLGLVWAWLHMPAAVPGMPQWMENRKEVDVRALVHAVRFTPEDRIQILLSDVRCKGDDFAQTLPGMTVWTWQDPPHIPAPGQKIHARLRIKPIDGFDNFHAWDSRAYWARQGVHYRSFLKGKNDPPVRVGGDPGTLWDWRQKLRLQVLEATEPGPGQGLLLALLMADRSRLEYATLDLVRRASLAHSLALSGLHLGFVISLGWAVAWGLGRIWPGILLYFPRPVMAVVLGVPLVLAYLWLGQGRESLCRAALMFGFWVLLMLSGRGKALLDGLFFALLVFLLADPLAVFSLGWQLSMTAVAGILLLWPVLGARFDTQRSVAGKSVFGLVSIFLLSLTANIALLPLITAHFGQISPHIYLNVLWLPVLGLIILPLGLSGMLLAVCPWTGGLGHFALHSAARILELLSSLLQWLHAQGWLEVLVTPRPGWLESIGYWLVLGAVMSLAQTRWRKSWAMAGLGGMLLAGPWLAAHGLGLGNAVQLRVLDVGQGQAVCLEGPQGKRTLIDGGGSWNPDFDLGRFAVSPALTYRDLPQVDTVLLSHPDFDHLRGLFYVLRHFDVQRFVHSGEWPTGEDGRILKEILASRDIPVRTVRAGDRMRLGEDLYMDVLHPPKGYEGMGDNDMSLVLRILYQGHGLALLPGDIEKKGLAVLMERNMNVAADVLLIPHHGSRGSLSPELYARVDPEMAVVSCGFLNIFRFPHKDVREALSQANVPVYCTSQSGEIQITWDINNMRKKTVRTRLGKANQDMGG